jgi:hypothetical protein
MNDLSTFALVNRSFGFACWVYAGQLMRCEKNLHDKSARYVS